MGSSLFPFYIAKATVHGVFPDHRHDFSELVIILGGTGIHRIDDACHFAKAGDVHVFKPGSVHGFADSDRLCMCNISYDSGVFSSLRDDVLAIPGFRSLFLSDSATTDNRRGPTAAPSACLAIHELRQAETMIDEMIAEFGDKKDGFESLLVGSFLRLVVFLSRNHRLSEEKSSDSLLRLAKAVNMIERRFTEYLPLRLLAEVSGLSARHLSRLFSENFRTSPRDYIIRTRLEYAAQLLRRESRSITGIAFDSGFQDSNYFSRKFRQFFGMTPTEYRQAPQSGAAGSGSDALGFRVGGPT